MKSHHGTFSNPWNVFMWVTLWPVENAGPGVSSTWATNLCSRPSGGQGHSVSRRDSSWLKWCLASFFFFQNKSWNQRALMKILHPLKSLILETQVKNPSFLYRYKHDWKYFLQWFCNDPTKARDKIWMSYIIRRFIFWLQQNHTKDHRKSLLFLFSSNVEELKLLLHISSPVNEV